MSKKELINAIMNLLIVVMLVASIAISIKTFLIQREIDKTQKQILAVQERAND